MFILGEANDGALFLCGRQMPKKSGDTDKRSKAPETDWERIDAMNDQQIIDAAKADPDAQFVPKGWFDRAAKRRAARKAAAE